MFRDGMSHAKAGLVTGLTNMPLPTCLTSGLQLLQSVRGLSVFSKESPCVGGMTGREWELLMISFFIKAG